ncbi:MAG: lipoprotein signal peptidase [Saprospiraceae bacterium]|nr:lipoprotein signal peptidase [Saprospiraceae bacterium]
MKRSTIVALTIIGVLILDQWLKVYVKTSIFYGEGFNILGLDWARIHFVENEGMAFGISFGGRPGKLLLSIFRILMVGLLFYLMSGLIKTRESKWLIFSFALIIAGAIGNIIDSAVYGLIFSESSYHSDLATFMPEGGGYAGFLEGKVVDMLYFPMIDSYWPDWVPVVGGDHFQFFRPVFNIADSAISTGVISILLFHRNFFTGKKPKVAATVPAAAASTPGTTDTEGQDQEEE